ncbi:MAG: GDP-L-fucose synthase [Deltaproteobacteria bacterium]|nr:GDP-L-fucose synthase [Deltaproteobacteria bacterium]
MDRDSRILVVNAQAFIGSAIARVLKTHGYTGVSMLPGKPSKLLDLSGVDSFFAQNKPEYVFLSAGKSAGIMGNIQFPAELMLDNLRIVCQVVDSAYRHGVKKLLFLASNCCYPKNCPQPMSEKYLLNGPLEPTNEPYAVAKIAGLKLVQSYRKQYGADFICGIPANSFGPGDDFSEDNSHVFGALIQRIHTAKEKGMGDVLIWGTGKPRREFMYVDDLADACIYIMNKYSDFEPVNLGPGGDLSIAELASMVKSTVGFEGDLIFDATKPDGMPIKLLNTAKLKAMKWESTIDFQKALDTTYAWFLTEKNTCIPNAALEQRR